MPLIQPIAPIQPVRAVFKPDIQDQAQPAPLANASGTPSDNEMGNQAVEPAAPPSALQMQIKALISEQAEPRTDDAEPDPEDLS